MQPKAIGGLTPKIQVKALDSLYKNDSLVKEKTRGMFGSSNELIVYEKGGKKLLKLEPAERQNENSTISNIEILDARFKTQKGIGKNSSFKEITNQYNISKIENTLSKIVVFIDEENLYFTIDKDNITGNARYNTSIKINKTQIPDNAKIEQLWLGWQ